MADEKNEKKYLDEAGLIRFLANIIDKFASKSEVESKVDEITSGSIVVKEAEHATNADTATNASNAANANHAATADSASTATTAGSATKATQDGNGKVISETYQTIADATSQHNALQSSIDNKIVMFTWESGD